MRKQTSGRLVHFTPLRYPGGKGKLASFIKQLVELNDLSDGSYAEPYAGGAAIALELLMQEYVSRIYINDISRPVHSFWKSVLDHTEELCRLVHDTKLSVAAWDRQKKIFANQAKHDVLSVGFATFYLNRTNRSGILNGGIIGGRDQTGPWKIDARYNAPELVNRIQSIANLKGRIKLTKKDALAFLRAGAETWPEKTLIYCDPPYYEKGRELYYDFYEHNDHAAVAEFVTSAVSKQRWIVSYDNVAAIRSLYAAHRKMTYSIGYSARSSRQGSEVMIFCNSLVIPPPSGSMSAVRTYKPRAA